MGLRQFQMTNLTHHTQGVRVIQNLLKRPKGFGVISNVDQPQRLRIQTKAHQPLRGQSRTCGVVLGDPKQGRRLVLAGVKALVLLLPACEQTGTESRCQTIIPFCSGRQNLLQHIVLHAPLQRSVNICHLKG